MSDKSIARDKCECSFQYCCDRCWKEGKRCQEAPGCENPECHTGPCGPFNNTGTIDLRKAFPNGISSEKDERLLKTLNDAGPILRELGSRQQACRALIATALEGCTCSPEITVEGVNHLHIGHDRHCAKIQKGQFKPSEERVFAVVPPVDR